MMLLARALPLLLPLCGALAAMRLEAKRNASRCLRFQQLRRQQLRTLAEVRYPRRGTVSGSVRTTRAATRSCRGRRTARSSRAPGAFARRRWPPVGSPTRRSRAGQRQRAQRDAQARTGRAAAAAERQPGPCCRGARALGAPRPVSATPTADLMASAHGLPALGAPPPHVSCPLIRPPTAPPTPPRPGRNGCNGWGVVGG
jgi:hypothetical protein